jgi:hypothetical protein
MIALSFRVVWSEVAKENAFQQMPSQGSDTLNILVSAANNIYY